MSFCVRASLLLNRASDYGAFSSERARVFGAHNVEEVMPLTVDGSADRIPTSADELQVSPPLQARLCNRRPRAYRPRRAQPLSQGLL
eukprot:CAMPEP_0174368128 /NCGR_PEP_ID=MMETSP0811_2-20130205/87900_1 /TAXON_ID=73025 ORGANISM="Eutreptiella gymnastica-like, Strain CCMP1594" /NCGR_SAMPLE_ID=MMETSP0811_2 /ASSEMBLY_ACC=CAM_ASM_000667 /LENGTH=86 /DNA_ID=CAMNT_0015511331 /DNA_START=1141 /DNA_END=1398 /DNA_ORIENTATION=+